MITVDNYYNAQLKEQVDLLIDSCHMYDRGFFSQAKIMSGIIRTLVKDPVKKTQTISLLTLLDVKDKIKFYNTGYSAKDPVILMNLVGFVRVPLFTHATNTYQRIYIPILDDSKMIDVKWIDFEDWWETDVIVDKTLNNDIHLSRKKIVLTMAEQDGGVHVDSLKSMDSTYKDIIMHTTNIIRHIDADGVETPIEYLQYALVRQIAHELLITIFQKFNNFKMYKPTNTFILGETSKEKIQPPFLIALNDGDLSSRTKHPLNNERGVSFVAPEGTSYVRLEFPS